MPSFSISSKHINRAKTKFREEANKANPREICVLEKLLDIDEQTANVMALDMITAGVDTVSGTAIVASDHQNNPISDRHDPNNESPLWNTRETTRARTFWRSLSLSLSLSLHLSRALFSDGNAAVS